MASTDSASSVSVNTSFIRSVSDLSGRQLSSMQRMEKLLILGCRYLNADLGILTRTVGEKSQIIQRSPLSAFQMLTGGKLTMTSLLPGPESSTKPTLKMKIPDTDLSSEEFSEHFRPASCLGLPFSIDGEVIGKLVFFWQTALTDPVTDDEIIHLRLLAFILEQEVRNTEQTKDLRHAEDEIRTLGSTDILTGLQNRRIFLNQLKGQMELALRYSRSISLIILDLDEFQNFNDSFGASEGDEALKTVSRLLQESARTSDAIARFGGEEFIILLAETNSDGAMLVAERVRKTISEHPWNHRLITASFGVSSIQIPEHTRHVDCDELMTKLIAAADEAMYWSKQSGRNRVSLNVLYQDHLS